MYTYEPAGVFTAAHILHGDRVVCVFQKPPSDYEIERMLAGLNRR